MRHLRPVTKAQLEWFDQSPLDILSGLIQFLTVIVPIIMSFIQTKQQEPTA